MVFTHNNSTFLVLLLLLVLFAASIATPLDDYILKEDSNYRGQIERPVFNWWMGRCCA
jgi:hypothetical protein